MLNIKGFRKEQITITNMYKIVSTFAALVILSQTDAACKFPVESCKRTDPNLTKCWTSKFLPIGTLAVKKLGMTSIDPWKSPAKISTRKEGYSLEESKFVYAGTSKYKVTHSNVNIEKNQITLTFYLPSLHASCSTMGTGKILGYELGGPSVDTVHANVTCALEMRGRRKMRKGREYLIFDNNNVKCKGQYSNITFKNLVKGTQKDNDNFAKEIEKRPDIIVPHLDMCFGKTIASDIVGLIAMVYDIYPLEMVNPK